jgi:PEP-CTERM motif
MNMHIRAVVACLSLFTLASAQAALSPIAATPENDVLDSITGLAWIKVTNRQDGVALGYRLATEAEALQVDYAGETESTGIYALGVDKTGDMQIGDTRAVRYAVSYGQVAGANGQTLLAGYSIDAPYTFRPMSVPPSFEFHTNHLFVGEQSLFADVVPEGAFGYATPRSRVSEGTGLACRAGGCFPGNTLWTGALDGGHGYFMVRSVVPEPANVALMALGLMGLLTLRKVKSRKQA